MRYYLGPRVPGSDEEADWLLTPEGALGLIDLRPGVERAEGKNGMCLIAMPDDQPLSTDYRLFHHGDIRDAVMPERERKVWASALGLKGITGTTLAEWLYDTLTLRSDPTGEGIGPLLPSWRGLEIYLDGLVIRRGFSLSIPEAAPVIELRRRQYRAIRRLGREGKCHGALHRKLLTDWGLKYSCTRPEDVFIPSDLPREEALPRQTTLTDRVNRANADAMGTSEEGWSWTEVQNDTDIISSGAFQGQGNTLNCASRAEFDLSSDDHACEIILNFLPTSNGGTSGPMVRFAAAALTAYMYGLRHDTSRHRLFTWLSAVQAQIGTTNNTVLLDRPCLARLTADGSTITAYDNPGYGSAYTQRVQTTDTSITGNTRVGLLLATTNTTQASARVVRGWDIPPDTTENLGTQLVADGVWTWFNHPRSEFYNGNTYVGWVNSDGDVGVSQIDASGSATSFTLHSAFEVDDHDNAAIYVRPSDGRIVCFYSSHSTESFLRYRISTNPEDISAFDSEQTLAIDDRSYAMAEHVSGHASPCWVWGRSGIGADLRVWGYHSTSDFSSWDAWQEVWTDTGTNTPYMRIRGNGVDRIDIVVTDKHPVNGFSSVYHFYMELDSGTPKWYKTDGTEITSPPFTSADATLVSDGSTIKRWIWDVKLDGNGNPRILFVRYPRGISGVDSARMGIDHRYMCARWTGSAWAESEIIDGGHGIYNPEVYYAGGACFDDSDADVIYLSKRIAGIFEVQKWVTADDGATWTFDSTVTKGSSVNNCRPASPTNHDGTMPVLWWRESSLGSYTTFIDYDTSIYGLINQAATEHATSGDLVGGGAVMTGTATRTPAPAPEHETSGVLVGGGAVMTGTATRSAPAPGEHITTGALVGGGAVMTGTALREHVAVEHETSGVLVGGGAVLNGTCVRFVPSGGSSGGSPSRTRGSGLPFIGGRGRSQQRLF